MGTLTVNATNGQTVAAGATYTVPYPAGKSASDYLTTGAKITTSDGSIYSATVSLGATITITNPTGRAVASGGFDYLDLNNAGVVARFGANGESDVLLGPKNEEVSMVTATADPITRKFEIPPEIGGGKRQAIRAAIEAAARNNPAIAEPWSKAPIWVALTAYAVQTVVRSIVAGSTDRLYICCNAGTSAAAPGPSALTNAAIVDGTVTWLCIGGGEATSSVPLWSTVNPTTSTDVMDGYVGTMLAANLAACGISATYYDMTVATTFCRLIGGVFLDVSGLASIKAPNSGTLAAPTRSAASKRWTAHFKTDCKKWLVLRPTGGNLSAIPYYIEVNGRPLTEGTFYQKYATASANLVLNMSLFGPGVKDVKISYYQEPTTILSRVYVAADEQIWVPTSNGLTLTIEGDSITATGGIGSYIRGWYIEKLIADQIGFDETFCNSQGGTGAIADSSGTKTTYIQRLPDVVENYPDVHIVAGFHNDGSALTEPARRAAVLAYLQACRAAMPNVTLVVLGSLTLQNATVPVAGQATYDMEVTAQNAFNDFNDDNSTFIPMLTNPVKWPRYIDNGWFYQAGGAAPLNDSHPTFRYYPALADYIVKGIRAFFAV